jgi:ferredoxin like protein
MSDAHVLDLSLADKLYRTKYEPDEAHPHIRVDDTACPKCEGKPCLFFCPAEVYKPNPNDKRLVTVSHENCLECGTCRYACPFHAIDWQNPAGGVGVKYRFG